MARIQLRAVSDERGKLYGQLIITNEWLELMNQMEFLSYEQFAI
jgi:hypothetical protein